MRLLICMGIITTAWLISRFWIWGGKLNDHTAKSFSLEISSRLGRSFGIYRFLWRNRIAAWGINAVIGAMLLLVAIPSPNLLACACSEVVVGSAATQWNNMYVDNTDGSLNLSQSDIYVPGYSPIKFLRSYWSNDSSWGPFGEGWSFNFDNYLLTTSGDISIYMKGQQQTFLAANGYVNAKATMKLTFIGTTEVEVQDRGGNSYYFDLTNGWMTSSFDKSGNETDYTWKTVTKQIGVDSSNNPINVTVYCPLSVTYQDGRQLLFTYSTATGQTYLCTQVETTSSGFTVGYSYTNGLLTGITKANGQVLSYGYYTYATSYETQGWLTSITYASGAEVNIAYNGNYGSTSPLRVTAISGPLGYSHTYGYTVPGTGDLTTVQTDGLGNNTTYAYTSIATVTSLTTSVTNVNEVETDALTNSARTDNNSNRQVDQFINKKGYSSYYAYDYLNNDPLATRNLLSVTNTLGKVTSFSYDGTYDVTNKVDPLGHSTAIAYDSYKHRIAVHNAMGQLVVTNTYNGYGKLASTANGAGNTSTFTYNSNGYVTNSVDPAGQSWTATYDADGNLLSSTNPLGKKTSFTYDSFYKIASITNALNQVTQFTRDSMANLTNSQDANGNNTSYGYDQLQRLTSVTNALGKVTAYAYNVENEGVGLTDANGNQYGNSYDPLNRVKTFTFPDSSQESYAYDADGDVTTITNRANQVISEAYDAADRLTTKTWSGTTSTAFNYGYDDANRVTGVTKITGSTTNSAISFSYNAANQLTNAIEGGLSVAHQYDNAHRLSQVAYPSGAQANYAYTALSKLSSITDESASAVSSYTYDNAGRLTKKTLANGLEDDYTYDDANRVAKIVLCQSSNTSNIVQSFQYGYDNVGNKLWVEYASGSGDVYQYDSTYQLTGVKYGVSNPTAGYSVAAGAARTVTYSYDAVGNRSGVVDSAGATSTYTVNNLNQYTAVAGQDYTYSSRGDLSSDGTWTYGYDPEGHLISASKTGTTVSYAYDALGRRIQKTVNGTVTNFVYDGNNLIEERNSAGSVLEKFIYGRGIDHPIRAIIGTTTYYFQQDSLGNVTALTDGSGNLAEQYTYDVFGTPTIKSGSGTTLSSAMTPFLFTGREYDAETGLYHYRTRAYSPGLGRFLQADSISFFGGDINIYRYVGNSPVDLKDPMGTCGDDDDDDDDGVSANPSDTSNQNLLQNYPDNASSGTPNLGQDTPGSVDPSQTGQNNPAPASLPPLEQATVNEAENVMNAFTGGTNPSVTIDDGGTNSGTFSSDATTANGANDTTMANSSPTSPDNTGSVYSLGMTFKF